MFGWDVPQKRFDWAVLRDNVLAEVGRLEGAYTETLTNHEVKIFHERATLTGPNRSGSRRQEDHRRQDPDRNRRAAG